jgi:hypothetical protein
VTISSLTIRSGGTATGLAAVAVLAFGLSGCGGGSTASTSAASPTGAAAAAGASGRRTGPRFDPAEQKKIQQCLEAAGIPVPTFTGRPSGFPSGQRPSGVPSGMRPSGTRGEGFGGRFADPKVRAALQACGITLPTRRPSGVPAAPPTSG